MFNYTLAIIKPDAVSRNLGGEIISILEKNNFKIIGMKMLRLNKDDAKEFYRVHKGKAFYESLTDYMSSSAIIAMLLYKENAIEDLRKLMGATDPLKAEENTIRKIYGINIEKNSIHGSDSEINAREEILYFFSRYELSRLGVANI